MWDVKAPLRDTTDHGQQNKKPNSTAECLDKFSPRQPGEA